MGDNAAKREESAEPAGLIQRLVALFTGAGDPEREKRRILKELGKDLQRQRFKFYKPKSSEALPALARVFFDSYKVVANAQTLLSGADSSNALKTILIEVHHNPEQARLRDELNDDAIRRASKTMEPKQLTAHLKDVMVGYFSGFDSSTVRRINDTYNLMQTFLSFAKFDFYFVLRKFDAGIQEGNLSYTPRFDAINAEYVSDDIKDFLEVVLPLDKDADWGPVFDALQEYKSVEVVDRDAWKKVLAALTNIGRSGVLTKIVQHVDQNPQYRPEVRVHRTQIVEGYLNLLKTQVEASIQRLAKERRTQKKDQLLTAVFGTTAIQRSKHYTESTNMLFTKRNLAGFLHIDAINYLKAFLVDYFKGEVRKLVSDILIVRGEWSDTVLSKQLSDAYYSAMSVAQAVSQFDDSLGEEGELGMKLKKASGRVVERDPATAKLLRQLLQEINERALAMINDSAQNLIVIGKVVKTLIEDLARERPEVLLNWKDLQGYSEQPLAPQLSAIYKRIYYFVQLMQMHVPTQTQRP